MKWSAFIYQSLTKTYQILPFKKAICLLLRWLPIKHEKFYKDLKFNGRFKIQTSDGHRFEMNHHMTTLENEVFWKGLDQGWEKISINIWKSIAVNSTYIVDIGANTGIYSLLGQAVNPDANIYSFEPSKRVYQKLETNVALNSFPIQISPLAISNKNGSAIFYDTWDDHQYSASLNSKMLDESITKKEIRVETMTLDTFFEINNVQGLDLIKIDVEKHEPEVIEGMKIILQKYQPTILIEILNDEIGATVENALKDYHYLFFNIDEVNPPELVNHLKASSHYNYLICNEKIAKSLNLI